MAVRMVQYGNKVTCFNRNGHHVSGAEFDGNDKFEEYKGVKLKKVFTINRKGLAAVTSSVSATVAAALGRYDIVHFHAEGSCSMLWLPKLFGKKCIVTIHGIDWKREKWKGGFGSKYIKFGEKMAVKYADEIIVLSKNMSNYFQQNYQRKTVLIPNGVNKADKCEPEQIYKKYKLWKDSYILYLGRLVPEKGVHYLVEAFKSVRTEKNWLFQEVRRILWHI